MLKRKHGQIVAAKKRRDSIFALRQEVIKRQHEQQKAEKAAEAKRESERLRPWQIVLLAA